MKMIKIRLMNYFLMKM